MKTSVLSISVLQGCIEDILYQCKCHETLKGCTLPSMSAGLVPLVCFFFMSYTVWFLFVLLLLMVMGKASGLEN